MELKSTDQHKKSRLTIMMCTYTTLYGIIMCLPFDCLVLSCSLLLWVIVGLDNNKKNIEFIEDKFYVNLFIFWGENCRLTGSESFS